MLQIKFYYNIFIKRGLLRYFKRLRFFIVSSDRSLSK